MGALLQHANIFQGFGTLVVVSIVEKKPAELKESARIIFVVLLNFVFFLQGLQSPSILDHGLSEFEMNWIILLFLF